MSSPHPAPPSDPTRRTRAPPRPSSAARGSERTRLRGPGRFRSHSTGVHTVSTQTEPFAPIRSAVDFGLELTRPEARIDPYPLFDQMRREDPVHYSPALGGWLVTRYDD